MHNWIGAMPLLLVLGACQQEQATTNVEAEKQKILQQEDNWNQAYASRDGEALARFYADDAALASPGEQLVRGKDSVRETMSRMAEDENLRLSFRANRVHVAESGDLGYTRGQFMMTATDPATNQPQTTRGYYLTVWQKQDDGSWKAVEDFITPGPQMQAAERASAIL